MGSFEISLIGFGAMLFLMALGMPISFAMLIIGSLGISSIVGVKAALGMLGQLPVSITMNYELSVVPMFVLMGTFVNRANLSRDLYDAAHAFLGHRRGGLAMATVVACGGFAAVCGSSLATAATMAKVAMPSMRRYGFSDTLAVGSIAAGGTLGILIPPSVILVIYGIMTGTDIGKLFLGGILPGLLTIGLYMLTIAITTTINPASGPRTERIGFAERFRRLKRVTAMVFLFLFIIGGIYLGIFTPTEAGGAGAFGALIFALWRQALTLSVFMECLLETAKMTTMLFIVLVGAIIFSNFVNLAGLPEALSKLITSQGVGPMGVIFNMMMVYLLLGCFLDSLAMILLTVPIFFPIVSGLGLNPIWFGIVVVMISELALITPPVGMNLFVIKSTVDGVTLPTIYRGIIPFAIADVVRITAVILFPGIPLLLPRLAG